MTDVVGVSEWRVDRYRLIIVGRSGKFHCLDNSSPWFEESREKTASTWEEGKRTSGWMGWLIISVAEYLFIQRALRVAFSTAVAALLKILQLGGPQQPSFTPVETADNLINWLCNFEPGT